MYCALDASHVEVAKLLIERGADIHARYRFGKKPLHCAAVTGWSDIVSHLLNLGADINLRDEAGHSALFDAVNQGQAATAKVLIEIRGCDLKCDSKTDDKFLFNLAAVRGLTEVLQLLLDKGLYGIVDIVRRCGETPLAARKGQYDAVTFLLIEIGASVNGRIVLHLTTATVKTKEAEDEYTRSYQGQTISSLSPSCTIAST